MSLNISHVAIQAGNSLETDNKTPQVLVHLYDPIKQARSCASVALDKKATNVVIFDVGTITSYADYVVVCSAQSERQVQAIASAIQDELKEEGYTPLHVEGLEQNNWVLIDYGDFVCHILLESARHYYKLDALWADAPQVSLD